MNIVKKRRNHIKSNRLAMLRYALALTTAGIASCSAFCSTDSRGITTSYSTSESEAAWFVFFWMQTLKTGLTVCILGFRLCDR